MRILIVYESNEKNNANYYTHLFINELKRYSNNNVSEVYLSNNFSNNLKCIPYNFFIGKPPDNNFPKINLHMFELLQEFHFIKSQIEKSNLIIFVPYEGSSDNENMKTLLRRLSYTWMPHRCNETLKNKIGVILSYISNPTLHQYTKDMKYDLLLCGLKNVIQIDTIKYKHMDYDLNLLKLSLMANKTYTYYKDIYVNKCFFLENLKNSINFNKTRLKLFIMNSHMIKTLILGHK